jgi:homoserine dehydrogenase
LKVGTLLVGFGNIGQNLASVLLRDSEYLRKTFNLDIRVVGTVETDLRGEFHSAFSQNGLDLRKLLDARRETKMISTYPDAGGHLTSEYLIRHSNAQLMLESTPTNLQNGQPGLSHLKLAIEAGMSAVTSNKGPLLFALKDLRNQAADRGVGFRYSAAVAGALPIIPTAYYGLAGCRVSSIEGILNGTCNYILTQMAQTGATLEGALAEAQQMGIAETNPKLDIQGYDTAFKLLVAANAIMDADKKIADVEISGIEHITQEMIREAREKQRLLKLVGRARKVNGSFEMKVGVEEVGSDHPFYSVNGIWKAVLFNTELLGEVVLLGGKSNPQLAAGAMVRDIVNLVQDGELRGKAA